MSIGRTHVGTDSPRENILLDAAVFDREQGTSTTPTTTCITICATDISTGIQWYNGSFVTTNATATILGAGNANTNVIVTAQGVGTYAAKLCYDLTLNGYSDWYLPSQDELNKLYLNKTLIGGFTNNIYWSSTEVNSSFVWIQYFDTGNQNYSFKNSSGYVRAIRSF